MIYKINPILLRSLAALALSAASVCVHAEVVVTRVIDAYSGARAGIQEGDRLVTWSRGANSGSFDTPFDLLEVAIAQSDFGTVEIVGERNGVPLTWELNVGVWAVYGRPAFDEETLGLAETLACDLSDDLAAHSLQPLDAAWIWQERALACVKSSDDPSADEALDKAVQWAEVAQRPDAAAQVIETAGRTYGNQGKPEQALKFLREAAKRRQSLAGNEMALATDLRNIGIGLSMIGDLRGAIESAQQALVIQREKAPQTLAVAETLHTLGNAEFWQGDLDAAEPFYREALELREALAPDSHYVARNLAVLGNLYWRRGDLNPAEAHYQAALDLQERVGADPINRSQYLISLGHVAHDRRDLVASDAYYQDALALAVPVAPEGDAVGSIWLALANNARIRGDLDAAQSALETALDIFEKMAPGGQRVSLALGDLSLILARQGDLESAQVRQREALNIRLELDPDGVTVPSSYYNLAKLHLRLGEVDAAKQNLDEALQRFTAVAPDSIRVAQTLSALGAVAFENGAWDEAQRHYEAASRILEIALPATYDLAEASHGAGMAAWRLGDVEQAGLRLTQAVENLDWQRLLLGGTDADEAFFAAQYEPIYKDLVDFLISQNQHAQALEAADSYRSQQLARLVGARGLAVNLALSESLRDDFSSQVARYRNTLERSDVNADPSLLQTQRSRLVSVAERIADESPSLAAILLPKRSSADELLNALPTGHAALSYVVGESTTWLFVISAQRELAVFDLGLEEVWISDAVRRMRTLVQLRGRNSQTNDTLDRLSRELYAALVAPAESNIAEADQVWLLPDGALHTLPFALLRAGDDAAPFLIQRTSLQTVGSLNLLSAWPDIASLGGSVVAFASPIVDDSAGSTSVTPANRAMLASLLPYTVREVEAINDVYGNRARVFKSDTATESALQANERAQIIHLATHGVVDNEVALNSYLTLSANPPNDDGRLYAWEVMERLQMQADLVTLSACSTALGGAAAGEGLIGLTRSFQVAGARTVMSSLWPVEDQATSQFMQAFYSALASGKSKAQALRVAQMLMIEWQPEDPRWWHRLALWRRSERANASDPYVWASFVLNGAP